MTDIAARYNRLPPLLEADMKFVNRDELFAKLRPLLAKYENKFGVCLVHRHCKLEPGEMMVATGNVCQPERDVQCYPDHWLGTGEPYEFNRDPTPSLPEGLLKEFQKMVGSVEVLGLFFVRDESEDCLVLERTEGRKNIVEIIPNSPSTTRTRADKLITTGWLLGQRINSAYECTLCVGSDPHTPSADKLEQLERRDDVGHEIGW
jgi:hypothetical protein